MRVVGNGLRKKLAHAGRRSTNTHGADAEKLAKLFESVLDVSDSDRAVVGATVGVP